jgi:hypothetical protein
MEGIYISGVEWQGGSNITMKDVHVTCQNDASHFQLWGGYCNAKIEGNAANLTMTGGEVGPTIDNDVGSYPGSSRVWGDNMVFDGVTFHNNERLPGGHSECLMIRGGDPVTVKNSKFLNCNIFNIFVTCFECVSNPSSPAAPDNILIENNYFGPGPQYFSIQVRDTNPATHIDYRYNTLYKPIDPGPGYGIMKGNIIAYSGGCSGDYAYRYNVWGDDIDRKCGDSSNTVVRSTAFTSDGIGFDSTGHLNTGSSAIGRGDPADYPPKDFDGQVRPIGVIDAGADER